MAEIDPVRVRGLLEKYDRPGPRYTSYPAAPHFHEGVGAAEYAAALAELEEGEPLSLYVHIPFCEKRCTYCGCFVVPTQRREIAETYIGYLDKEFGVARERLRVDPNVHTLHFGGGTPSYLTTAELGVLFDSLEKSFGTSADGKVAREISVELDPRVTTREQLELLRRRGANRVSLGVQDTSDEVQQAIGRCQTREQTRGCFETCRELGFDSVNVDLVYGLPRQTQESLKGTLDDVRALRPDRLAVFAYAHVPWIRPHQKEIDPVTLPGPEDRLNLFMTVYRELTAQGYRHIGLDHYALEDDELARAQAAGNLARNFMGYTTCRRSRVLGFGVSSIGDVRGSYFQNEKKLARYFSRLDGGELPIERGWVAKPDDALRRYAIQEVLCNLRLDAAKFENLFDAALESYFEVEWPALEALAADGLIELTAEGLRVLPVGRLFLRNIAMTFDAYLRAKPGSTAPRYSRTV